MSDNPVNELQNYIHKEFGIPTGEVCGGDSPIVTFDVKSGPLANERGHAARAMFTPRPGWSSRPISTRYHHGQQKQEAKKRAAQQLLQILRERLSPKADEATGAKQEKKDAIMERVGRIRELLDEIERLSADECV